MTKLIKELKPFWNEYRSLLAKHWDDLREVENKMNHNRKIPLEFFYVDGECVGIGAKNYKDRKKIKLMQDTDLDG